MPLTTLNVYPDFEFVFLGHICVDNNIVKKVYNMFEVSLFVLAIV